MPISFRHRAESDDFGLAAYLRFVDVAQSNKTHGVLFLVNAQAEPIEFCFTSVEEPASTLWHAGGLRRWAVRELSKSLFGACSKEPSLVMALAVEVPAPIFTEDLEVQIPVCRVSDSAAMGPAASGAPEPLDEDTHLLWVHGAPDKQTSARKLFAALYARQLVFEPFDRATKGLEEALSRV